MILQQEAQGAVALVARPVAQDAFLYRILRVRGHSLGLYPIQPLKAL